MSLIPSSGCFEKAYRPDTDTHIVKVEIPGSFMADDCQQSELAKSLGEQQIFRVIVDAILLSYGLEVRR